MASKSRNIAVIGLGSFGGAVAEELTRIGDKVLGVDNDPARVTRFSGEIDSTVEADASDGQALEQCGLDKYDAVVISIGEDMEASLLATTNALELGCPSIWVKAQNRQHAKILKQIGVKHVVQPELHYGQRLAYIIHNDQLEDFLLLGGDQLIARISINAETAGQKFTALQPEGVAVECLGIFRNNQLLSENCADTVLSEGDALLVYGGRDALRRLADKL